MPENNSVSKGSNRTRIVTNVLSKAVKLWLRSQVSQISTLEVDIQASDRQILSGYVPGVSIVALNAVYQGLHLTQVQLVAESIQLNIGSILKGQPLRLQHQVPVVGELTLEEKDLNASLSSALLLTALNDALFKLLPEYSAKSKSIIWQKITLDNNKLILSIKHTLIEKPAPLHISVGLELINPHQLLLTQINVNEDGTSIQGNQLNLDLGSDVDIKELTLIPGKLVCRGRINVNP
jgi:hypothetical protein